MNDEQLVRRSKLLARYLRHSPAGIGLELDPGGWVAVEELLAALAAHGTPMSRAQLEEVVARNNKRRYAFDETGARIRASQGHSVPVDLALPVAEPPDVLYHGTVERALPSIMRDGLRPMRRHDVHLSATVETAASVGARRGRPVVLVVDAAAMTEAGHEFRVSANGVWLTPSVPPEFLRRL